MEWIERLLLIIHISGGFLGLVIGIVTVILQKGTRNHKRLGTVFSLAMATACVSGLMLATVTSNAFLFMVAIFSGYALIHGVRAIHFLRGNTPTLFDKVVFYISVVAHVSFLLYGVIVFFQQGFHVVGFLSILFGFGGLALNASFSNHLFHPPARLADWIIDHITGIMTSFIASVTAFSSTTLHPYLPVWVIWLWPTLLFVPLIVMWIKQQRYKMR